MAATLHAVAAHLISQTFSRCREIREQVDSPVERKQTEYDVSNQTKNTASVARLSHSKRKTLSQKTDFKMATSSFKTNKSIFEATAAETVIGGLSADILDDAHEDIGLRERIVSQLRHSRIPMFQKLQIDVQNGEVTVIGAVETAFDKQLLARSLKQISGVKKWRLDSVKVLPPPVYREPLLRRLRVLLPSHRTIGWVVAVSVASFLMIVAPWAKPSRGVDTVPVSGEVFFEGQKAFGAFVTLHPVKGTSLPNDVRPVGYVQPDGQVKFSTFEAQDGVPPGEYLVAVRWNKLVKNGDESAPGPNVLPERYLSPTTSGLKVKVAAEQSELPPLQLKR